MVMSVGLYLGLGMLALFPLFLLLLRTCTPREEGLVTRLAAYYTTISHNQHVLESTSNEGMVGG
jgi:hypothetical protein